jgi:hypothetical protein
MLKTFLKTYGVELFLRYLGHDPEVAREFAPLWLRKAEEAAALNAAMLRRGESRVAAKKAALEVGTGARALTPAEVIDLKAMDDMTNRVQG